MPKININSFINQDGSFNKKLKEEQKEKPDKLYPIRNNDTGNNRYKIK